MRRLGLLITILLAAPVPALAAQDSSTAVGQRVRIKTTTTSQWLVGTLAGADEDSLRLWLQGPDGARLVAVPRSAVMKFQVSCGEHSNAGRDAIVGGVIFGTLGLIAGLGCESEQNSWFTCSGSDVANLTVLAAAEGAGIGALIGAFSHSERWQNEPLTRSRVAVAPYGTGVRVSIAF